MKNKAPKKDYDVVLDFIFFEKIMKTSKVKSLIWKFVLGFFLFAFIGSLMIVFGHDHNMLLYWIGTLLSLVSLVSAFIAAHLTWAMVCHLDWR